MSNKKFQRVENPRHAQKLVNPNGTLDDGSDPRSEGEKQVVAEMAKQISDGTDKELLSTVKAPEPPVRENAPVEERQMSFQERRDMGIPAGFRNLFFNGR